MKQGKRAISVLLILMVLTGFLFRPGYVTAAPVDESVPETQQTGTATEDSGQSEEPSSDQGAETEDGSQSEEPDSNQGAETEDGSQSEAPASSDEKTLQEEGSQEPSSSNQDAVSEDDSQLEDSVLTEDAEMSAEEMPDHFFVLEGDGVIQLDGDFSDWVDKPSYDSTDHEGAQDDALNKVQWHLSQEEKMLYIMTSIHRPPENGKGSLKTQIKTDFGQYQMEVDYQIMDAEDPGVVSVMTSLETEQSSWAAGGNWGRVMSDGSIGIEYVVPLEEMLKGMRWGYLIEFRLLNGSYSAPKNSWISISSASTFPVVGVAASIAAGLIIPTLMKRKKETC